ncbi:MAG: response regulator [Proteobacteria bacterium]|nr:response regulator [Pseudomonadota bacterium]MBU1386718.1 response regulator [Pseudomonadota bacterium]MBU1544366.1 response regulator [Pseudomonadota bacterium]MBU2431427.1 response regulator [Pseudomonadota bacterium]MBU2481744.1 response regulator [Pseudomonadota bacterium]
MKTKLLLVDDEKEFIDTLAARLELKEFDVSVAYSGNQALDMMKDHEFDVVILDVLMPGIDGIETLKHMKSMAPLTQIIMLTGNATVDNAILGMKNGAYDFLLKPAESSILVQKITAAFTVKNEHQKRIDKANVDNIVASRGW